MINNKIFTDPPGSHAAIVATHSAHGKGKARRGPAPAAAISIEREPRRTIASNLTEEIDQLCIMSTMVDGMVKAMAASTSALVTGLI